MFGATILRMTTPRAIGSIIRERMAPRIQADLARQMGVSRVTVNELINNNRRVTAVTAVKLAKSLGNDPAWWMDRQRDVDLHRLKL